jgi:hypothetical protein
LISLRKRFLFIHIPKTGGNSIQNVLHKYSEEKLVCIAPYQDGIERFEVRSDHYPIQKHASLAEYERQLGHHTIDPLYKFTCVRNPWERVVSFYFSPHRGDVMWDRDAFVALLDHISPVSSYVRSQSARNGQSHFEYMTQYLRFENLQRDFELVCQNIGIPSEQLQRRNVSRHEHYSRYYDSELAELVANRFRDEIEQFGFKFEAID